MLSRDVWKYHHQQNRRNAEKSSQQQMQKKKGRVGWIYRRRRCPVEIFKVLNISRIYKPLRAIDTDTIKLLESILCIVRMLELYKSVGPEELINNTH